MMPPRLVSRREALTWLALFPAFNSVASAWSAADIRIATSGELPEDVRNGIDFGLREASHTAQLLQKRVERTADLAAATVVIAGTAAPRDSQRREIPVIHVLEPAAGAAPCRFRVAVGADAARAAADRWRASHPAGRADVTVVEWDASLTRFGASELNERYTAAYRSAMTPGAWRGWFAVKAAAEAALRGRAGCDEFRAGRFDGHKGRPLTFAADGSLQQPLYVLQAGRIVGEIEA